MKLIQGRQPRFNVQHKRRRIYAFVKVTNERAPRVLPVTRVVEDGATYYGPFPRVGALAHTVRELGHILGLRDCPGTTPVYFGDQLEIFQGGRPPRCLRADLRTCLAPCCGRPTAGEYAAAVETARRFRDEMVAFRGRVEDLSFVYRVPGFRGDDRIYFIRKGRILREMPHPKGRRARERVATAIEEAYGEVDLGPRGMAPEDAAEILLVAQWFRLRPKERRRTLSPKRWLEEKGPLRERAS